MNDILDVISCINDLKDAIDYIKYDLLEAKEVLQKALNSLYCDRYTEVEEHIERAKELLGAWVENEMA